MATKQVKAGTVSRATGRRAVDPQVVVALTPEQHMAAALAAAAPATVQSAPATSVTPPQASTPLPANWVATAPAAAASAQVFNNYRLPNSLQAKGANLCGGELGKLANAKLLPGKPFMARSGHNAAWAATALALAQAAAPSGGVAAAAVLAAGVGAHSIKAYVKRGWLKVA